MEQSRAQIHHEFTINPSYNTHTYNEQTQDLLSKHTAIKLYVTCEGFGFCSNEGKDVCEQSDTDSTLDFDREMMHAELITQPPICAVPT